MSNRLKIVTWNINSVRLRLPIVEKMLLDHAPDVLCLQETKCPDGSFPSAALEKLGYRHIEFHGQKGYHGVALISRVPLENVERREFCGMGDTRHIAADIAFNGSSFRLHNFYVPAGGDIPDPELNDKFAHKLKFLDEMEGWFSTFEGESIVVGDLNIAPYETDVWSHKQLLKVVSHTPLECERLEAVRNAGKYVDTMRKHIPMEEKVYTWWSYRAKDWSKADKGRRLDHVWMTAGTANHTKDVTVMRDARGWEKPSDHAPVVAVLEA
ncbi:exodeoxyribonuclease III [Pseudovibrio exalbescens]|uniref:exodeoxyribonuclease III n=1 Tax=Pseudovibrio exalbescens TaxID=197461 RepID=UPI002365E300|nr:exodeoxyribonuclease III [Pseudovibrio exalbescens]MDD7909387.1 exodeoxyribonuclease III [Pseudovibrio exalbescens]